MFKSVATARNIVSTGRKLPVRTAMVRGFSSYPSRRSTVASLPIARPVLRQRPLFGLNQVAKRTMFIQTVPTPNDDAIKFIPSVEVLPAEYGTIEFTSGREAYKSPLARRLFSVDGVKAVMFGNDFVTISKDPDYNWAVVKPDIFSILNEYFTSGAKVIVDSDIKPSEDTAASEDDSEVVSMIKELIDTRVRPAIQEDGGDILYRGFDEETGTVFLKLQGACRSCSSSEITLKNGIESMLMHYIEEVQKVEQVLDPEEEISLKEFEKLESKLSAKKQEEAPPAL